MLGAVLVSEIVSVASVSPVRWFTTGRYSMVRSRKLSILLPPPFTVTTAERVLAADADARKGAVHADEVQQLLFRGSHHPTRDVTVEHGWCQGRRHLLRWWKRGIQHVVDGGVDDCGEKVLAFVLGELVLVDGEEPPGVVGVDSLADVGEFDRPGDLQEGGDADRIDDEDAVDRSSGRGLVHLGHGIADARHVGWDGDVAPVLLGYSVAVQSAVAGVALHVLVSRVEIQRVQRIDLELGGSAACR